jgi:hypothetical protein
MNIIHFSKPVLKVNKEMVNKGPCAVWGYEFKPRQSSPGKLEQQCKGIGVPLLVAL